MVREKRNGSGTVEYYGRSKTLATVTHCGVNFRVVRKRIDGKLWRKYLTLCHGDVSISERILDTIDPVVAADAYRQMLVRTFPNQETLLAALRDLATKRYA